MNNKTPDQAVLEAAFGEFHAARYPVLDEGAAFELFVAGELLKGYALSDADIEKGVVGNESDGGIDSFYVFLNETELLDVDSPVVLGSANAIATQKTGVPIDLYVIQSKWSTSWKTDPVSRIRDTLEEVLPLDADPKDLEARYNGELVERSTVYRNAFRNLLGKSPQVRLHVAYVTKGPRENLADNVHLPAKVKRLEENVGALMPTGATVEVELLGATEMCEVLRSSAATVAAIEFSYQPVQAEKSFVGLVKLRDYLRFARKEGGQELLPGLFESNVRDFSGESGAVNAAIRETATTEGETSFWWLNNGVTILADEAQYVPPLRVTVTRPLVVNGLQTTHVLHEADSAGDIPAGRLDQSLMVRIITESEPVTRDAIIAGTNRQTSIPTLQLHATERLHREIEEFLATRGWYYERRKHQYRGTGRPASRIITIGQLAQAMITLVLGRPDEARARPTSAVADHYDKVFDPGIDRGAYAAAAELMDGVDTFLASDDGKAVMNDRTNARYYVALGYSMKTLRAKSPAGIRWGENFPRIKQPLDPSRLKAVLQALRAAVDELQAANPNSSRDSIFKGRDLTAVMVENLG